MEEAKIKDYLLEILKDLYNNKISKEMAMNKLSQNKELIHQVVEENVNFYISDCFWTIKHLLEEDVTDTELKYFIDCFTNKRKYNLKEKNEEILKNKNIEVEEVLLDE